MSDNRIKLRRRVERVLEVTRLRLKATFNAERMRDGITERRKRAYVKARKEHGDKHPETIKALRRLRDSRRLSRQIDDTQETLRKRIEQKLEWLEEHPAPRPDRDGDLIEIDGKPVSAGVGREVLRIRAAGRWGGSVVSGYRTPEHSESLCFGMCGKPSCPGMCAGRSSRHTQKGGRNGAVDVSEWWTFRQECERLHSWLDNILGPADPVHFSDIGN